MGFDVTFEAYAQLAEGSEPGMGSLDHPAMLAQPVVALDAPSGDSVFDATPLEVLVASRVVVAFVCVQFVRPAQRSATHTGNRR